MFRRILAAAITLALAAFLLVIGWPQLFGLQRAPGVAHAVSFRGVAFVVALALIVLFTLIALISPRLRRFAAGLALVLVVFAAVTFGVLVLRGLGNSSMPTKAPEEVTVLNWNTLGDSPGAQVIADLVVQQEADVVSLPEPGPLRSSSARASVSTCATTPGARLRDSRASSRCPRTEPDRRSSPRIRSPRSPGSSRSGATASTG
jgi:hypothetical protein